MDNVKTIWVFLMPLVILKKAAKSVKMQCKIPLIMHIASAVKLAKCIVIHDYIYGPSLGHHTIWIRTHPLPRARPR